MPLTRATLSQSSANPEAGFVRSFISPPAVRPLAGAVLVLVVLTAAASISLRGQSSALVPAGSVWRYLDNGSDQGAAWRLPGFNDAGWASGLAQLGYGDGDEATVVGYGGNASAKYITTYFRRTFSVTNPAN